MFGVRGIIAPVFVWRLGRVLAGLTEAVHPVTSFRLIIEHFRAKSPPHIKGLFL
jgi:hypothetical protein